MSSSVPPSNLCSPLPKVPKYDSPSSSTLQTATSPAINAPKSKPNLQRTDEMSDGKLAFISLYNKQPLFEENPFDLILKSGLG